MHGVYTTKKSYCIAGKIAGIIFCDYVLMVRNIMYAEFNIAGVGVLL